MSYPPAYLEFVSLFNARHFFEAHEMLEKLWLSEKGKDRNFFQGLIQIAAVFVHLEKKNVLGAQRLLKTASGYLEPYAPSHYGVSIHTILQRTREAMAACEAHSTASYYLIEISK